VKLAVSNIAWPSEDEPVAAQVMTELGITGVEVAPTMVWDDPASATDAELDRYRGQWHDRGIEVVALQALLFGHPELTLFDSQDARERTLEHLRAFMRIGGRLGARVLVFGAPKNRLIGERSPAEAFEIAVDFFGAAGAAAASENVVIAIEPNPKTYGCDFVTTSSEGVALVNRVSHPGFGLHLDAAGLHLAGESPPRAIATCADSMAHFHISEPHLAAIDEDQVGHADVADELRRKEYPHWTSVEMRSDLSEPTEARLRRIFGFVSRLYSG